jgi:hypothetical protein
MININQLFSLNTKKYMGRQKIDLIKRLITITNDFDMTVP